ncbi:twin-arginine translocation signal domain-containing protein [Granulosicoccus antarcticus]
MSCQPFSSLPQRALMSRRGFLVGSGATALLMATPDRLAFVIRNA